MWYYLYMILQKIEENLIDLSGSAVDENDKKRVNIFLEWVNTKTELFTKEKDGLIVPPNRLPRYIEKDTFDYLYENVQKVLQKYYIADDDRYKLKNNNVDQKDAAWLYKKLVLIKRNIIWVDFGCNIGCEFGGKHPAVILKNLGESLIVCPISTDKGKLRAKHTTIELDETDVFNLSSSRKRFIDITRLTAISVLRVDVESCYGSLRNIKFYEILDKLKEFYK